MSRRRMILSAGGAALALACAGGVWRVTRRPKTALAPWTLDPTPPADVRLDAFRHAILAPNPHNRQPWLIRLVGTDAAIIRCDLDRRLPQTDPFDRQITIGFGTFLETARIAAAQRGVRMDITPFPEGEPAPRLDQRPVAALRFVPDASLIPDPLFAAITRRHTNREVYDAGRPVSARIAAHISDGDFTVDPRRIAAIRPITVGAITTETRTPRTHGETVRLIRAGHAAVDANPDGIALTGPMMEALSVAGQLDPASLADPTGTSFQTAIEMLRETYGSIPALIWITTPGNSRLDQLDAGRRYVRAHLRATALGMAMHPMSQALQEYPEIAPAFAAIHRQLGARANERVQMLARIGYAPAATPAPRWPLDTHFAP